MKERPFYDFQRKEIADFAEVTPALISYYFPEKLDLVFEASNPIITKHLGEISLILNNNNDAFILAKRIIREYIELGINSGYTLDYFTVAIQKRNKLEQIALLSEQNAALKCFMEEVAKSSFRENIDMNLIQSVIWGQCIYISRLPHLPDSAAEKDRCEVIASLTNSVYDFTMKGLRCQIEARNV